MKKTPLVLGFAAAVAFGGALYATQSPIKACTMDGDGNVILGMNDGRAVPNASWEVSGDGKNCNTGSLTAPEIVPFVQHSKFRIEYPRDDWAEIKTTVTYNPRLNIQ